MAPRGYRMLDYMSDAFVEAYGGTMPLAFAAAGKGLLAVMTDVRKVRRKEEVEVGTIS
ncbi:MAG: archease, partial [Nitrososphaerota archaeon]|nr:archease [Nitrososphaerota archaeon]